MFFSDHLDMFVLKSSRDQNVCTFKTSRKGKEMKARRHADMSTCHASMRQRIDASTRQHIDVSMRRRVDALTRRFRKVLH